jgi:hypothetical protein
LRKRPGSQKSEKNAVASMFRQAGIFQNSSVPKRRNGEITVFLQRERSEERRESRREEFFLFVDSHYYNLLPTPLFNPKWYLLTLTTLKGIMTSVASCGAASTLIA